MKRVALFIAMKLINFFSLECEVLDLLTPKLVPVPEYVDMSTAIQAAAKKNLNKIKKELPKKPLLKKKAKKK